MNPRTIRWQAAVNFVLLLFAAFVVAPTTVFWLAGPALVWALAFNFGYAYSLRDRGRPGRRIEGDRWVARYVAFGLLLSLFAAFSLWLFGYNQSPRIWDFTVNETSSLFVGVAALFVLIICSSIIDWYYIRPQIDGVVCAPPCRSSGSERWKGPTRWWYLHRGLATLAHMAFALVVALVVMLMLAREHPAAASVIGGVGGIAGLLLIFAGNYRAQLPTSRSLFSPPPTASAATSPTRLGNGVAGGLSFTLRFRSPSSFP